jgi:hypothetical protein
MCLRLVGREQEKQGNGGMVVISQLEFRRYLDKQTDPISAAVCDNLPRPDRVLPDGEVDALVMHSKYGLIPMELKAVWGDTSWTQTASPQDLHTALVNTVDKAIKQLDKNMQRLQHAVSDMPPVHIAPTLVLQNVTRWQLGRALVTQGQSRSASRNLRRSVKYQLLIVLLVCSITFIFT